MTSLIQVTDNSVIKTPQQRDQYILPPNGSLTLSMLTGTLQSAFPQWVVGSSAQVTAGLAHYSSLQSAINAATADDTILLLNASITENITLNKRLKITGKGHSSSITGTFAVSVDFCVLRDFAISGNITITSNKSFIEIWQPSGTLTDSGTDNAKTIIQG
jgi:hypothetical protein